MKFLLFFLAFGGTGQSVPPGVQNQIRPELENLEIRERLGERVADISFVDEEGNQHSLSSYAGDLPLILIPAYNRCKNLCPMVLKGVLEGLRGLNLRAGKDYRLLTVSFDSSDGMALTREAAKRYRQALIPPEAWRFVPGTDTAAVRPLLRSVGYPFRPIPGKGMFAHVAAVVVLTPDLRVSRYLYGITFRPRDLRLALLEAGKGRIGSVVDRVLLYCYRYDPKTGGYGLVAVRLMQVMGGMILLFVGGLLGILWYHERKQAPQRRV